MWDDPNISWDDLFVRWDGLSSRGSDDDARDEEAAEAEEYDLIVLLAGAIA